MTFILTDGTSKIVKYPYTLSDLKKDNPNTSFPKNPSEMVLQSFNVYFVSDVAKPNIEEYETLKEDLPVFLNGKWLKTYLVRPMFMEFVDDEGVTQTVEMQIDNYNSNIKAQARSRMTCTPRQARLALSRSGRYGEVKQFMAQLPADQKEEAEIEWEYATTFERTSGLLVSLTAAMGMTEQEVDELFELAATL